MLFKLARNNIMRSKTYFLVYAITIAVFLVLIYSTTVTQTHFEEILSYLFLAEWNAVLGMPFALNMIYLIIFAFSIYIIRFFLNRRKKEIALYKLFGLPSFKIWQIFLIENTLIIIIAFVLGMLLGMFFSRFILMIATAMLQLSITTFPLTMPVRVIEAVLFTLIVIYIMMNIMPIFIIAKTNIKQLFERTNRSLTVRLKNTKMMFIIFLIAIIALLCFILYAPDLRSNMSFLLIVLLILTIIYCFFSGISRFITNMVKRTKLYTNYVQNRNNRFPIFSFIALSFTSVMLIYYLFFVTDTANIWYFFLIFFDAILVVFFMYRGIFFTFFYLLKKRKIHFRSPIMLLTTNHFLANINNLNFILSFVTVLTAIIASSITLVFGVLDLSLQEAATIQASATTHFSFATFDEHGEQELETFVKTNTTAQTYNDDIVSLSALLHESDTSERTYAFVSKTNMQQFFAQIDFSLSDLQKAVEVVDGRTILVVTEETDKPITEFDVQYQTIGFEDTEQRFFDLFQLDNETNLNQRHGKMYGKLQDVIPIIVSDHVYTELSQTTTSNPFLLSITKSNFLNRDTQSLFNFISRYNYDAYPNVYLLKYFEFYNLTMVNFIYSNLQLMFMIVTIAVIIALIMTLFFRTLELTENTLEEYQITSLIGLERKKIYNAILFETAFTQLLPFYIGFLGGLFVFGGASKFIFNNDVAAIPFSIWDTFFVPSSLLLFVGLFISVHVLYIGLNYNIRRKIEQRII